MIMKKIIISLCLCLCVVFTTMAQDTTTDEYNEAAFTSRRGVALLPKAGDFALGIDASPFLTYLGGFLSSSGRTSPDFNGVNQTIYGKYFIEDDRAIRARLSLNMYNRMNKSVVRNDEEVINNPLNANATVIDVRNVSRIGVELGAGYEFRRGKGRVQGFYGGEISLGFNSGEKAKYEWANPMTEVNQAPSTTNNWATGAANSYSGASSRSIEYNPGKTFSAGLGGFVGVEYFFAPQISLGGELGLGAKFSMTGQNETTSESWNVSANKLENQTVRSGRWTAQDMTLNTLASGGKIFIMFHF